MSGGEWMAVGLCPEGMFGIWAGWKSSCEADSPASRTPALSSFLLKSSRPPLTCLMLMVAGTSASRSWAP